MNCGDCKHWFDNGTDYCSCDRDALLRERNFFCAAWERKKPFERPTTNADRIRSMTDDGIEDWYWWMHKEMMRYTNSRVFVHDWLKATVEEADNG